MNICAGKPVETVEGTELGGTDTVSALVQLVEEAEARQNARAQVLRIHTQAFLLKNGCYWGLYFTNSKAEPGYEHGKKGPALPGHIVMFVPGSLLWPIGDSWYLLKEEKVHRFEQLFDAFLAYDDSADTVGACLGVCLRKGCLL